jgi:hypothetical protein
LKKYFFYQFQILFNTDFNNCRIKTDEETEKKLTEAFHVSICEIIKEKRSKENNNKPQFSEISSVSEINGNNKSKRSFSDLCSSTEESLGIKNTNENNNHKIRRLDNTNIAVELIDFQNLRLFNEFSSNINTFSKKLKPYQKLNPFFNYTDVEYSKQISTLNIDKFDEEFYLKKYNIKPAKVILEKFTNLQIKPYYRLNKNE